MITGLEGVSNGDLERCYYRIGIFEMEMYQMMDSFKPRNFLLSGSPRCRSDQLEVPEAGGQAFFYHLRELHHRPSQHDFTSVCILPPLVATAAILLVSG
jgi:hypothetical protein